MGSLRYLSQSTSFRDFISLPDISTFMFDIKILKRWPKNSLFSQSEKRAGEGRFPFYHFCDKIANSEPYKQCSITEGQQMLRDDLSMANEYYFLYRKSLPPDTHIRQMMCQTIPNL